jgi:peptidoglycan/xylan/chitin deacetylase (PgdA/CDA1 family)
MLTVVVTPVGDAGGSAPGMVAGAPDDGAGSSLSATGTEFVSASGGASPAGISSAWIADRLADASKALASLNGAEGGAALVRTVVGGKPLFCDTPSRIVDDRLLIPVRPVAEAFGLKVEWDDASKKAMISSEAASAVFKIGSRAALIDGVRAELPVAPALVGDAALAPAAIIAAFAEVEWDADGRVVSVGGAPPETDEARGGAGPIRVLMYHEIGDGPSTLFVREREFEAQMRFLYENGYDVISMDDALKVLKGEKSVKNGVVITFDDGYASFFGSAWGVLKKYGFPATVYAISASVGSEGKYLSWDEMRFLEANWMDVGSHSASHSSLSDMDAGELAKEIGGSKAAIESETDYPCNHFCYPGGFYSDAAVAAVREAGYESAVTIRSGKADASSDIYRLPRLFIRRGVSEERFAKILRTGIT